MAPAARRVRPLSSTRGRAHPPLCKARGEAEGARPGAACLLLVARLVRGLEAIGPKQHEAVGPKLNNFCHSRERVSDPSLTLDLGTAIQLAYVAVYNRRDCCQDRLADYTVSYRVRSTDAWTICTETTAAAGAIGPLLNECSQLAQYVRVQLPGAGRTLNLAEVEVYSLQPN